jgi:hypothetical protein
MKYGAQPDDRIAPAPVSDVVWIVRRKGSDAIVLELVARRWIDARTEAARVLGCEPGELLITLEGQ